MTEALPIVAQIRNAADHRERAALLLQCPDAAFLACVAQLADACRDCGFVTGAKFVDLRFGALNAVRDAQGLPPAWYREARAAFASFAAGPRDRGAADG